MNRNNTKLKIRGFFAPCVLTGSLFQKVNPAAEQQPHPTVTMIFSGMSGFCQYVYTALWNMQFLTQDSSKPLLSPDCLGSTLSKVTELFYCLRVKLANMAKLWWCENDIRSSLSSRRATLIDAGCLFLSLKAMLMLASSLPCELCPKQPSLIHNFL